MDRKKDTFNTYNEAHVFSDHETTSLTSRNEEVEKESLKAKIETDRAREIRANLKRRQSFRYLILVCFSIMFIIVVCLAASIFISVKRATVLRSGYKAIEQNIENHNYPAAATRCNDLSKDYNSKSVQNKLISYDKEIMSNAIDYATDLAGKGDFATSIEMLTNLSSIISSEEIDDAISEIRIMEICETLEQYNSRNDILGAIGYLNKYADANSNIDTSMLKIALSPYFAVYKSFAISEAEKYANDGNYSSAVSLLKEINTWTDDNDLQSAIMEYSKSLVWEHLPDDIESIISYLKDAISKYELTDPEIIDAYNSYAEEYKNNTILQARQAFDYGDYKTAIGILHDAHNLIPEDRDIISEITIIEGKKPMDLLLLTPYSGNDLECTYFTDNMGVAHNSAICRKYSNDPEFESSYKLNGKYSRMTMNLAVRCDNKNMPNDTGIFIYTDGEIAYSYDSNSDEKEPVKIEVDLTGVDDLRIHLGRVNAWGRCMVLSEVTLYQ